MLSLKTLLKSNASDDEALAHAAWFLSIEVNAKAILATTISGKTARMIARFRPEMPIIVVCEDERTQRQLALSWGLVPFVLPKFKLVDKLIEAAVKKAKLTNLVKSGEKMVIVSGQPTGRAGANLVKVQKV